MDASPPLDPLYPPQWHLADVGWDDACAIECGDGSVVVAVIDSGIQLDHEDLARQIWTNPGESGSLAANRVDDDGNGFVDDWRGWDFRNGDNDPNDSRNVLHAGDCGDSHGTGVAGVVGAATGNLKGIAGFADARLMALRTCNGYGSGAQAIRYAAANGARVVSMSWEADLASGARAAVRQAIADVAAANPGIVLVASAGNVLTESPCEARKTSYPAADPLVIGVAGTSVAGTLSVLSYWGPEVDVAAPMEAITTTALGTVQPVGGVVASAYQVVDGTSYSTPLVAGAVALLLSANPDLTRDDVMGIVRGTASPILMDPLHGECAARYEFGKLDAQAALAAARGKA